MSKFENMAKDIYNFCIDNDIWSDCIIYFDGMALSSFSNWNNVSGKRVGIELYKYEDKNPLNYFKYANPDTLSMSFEGELYDIVNDFGCEFPGLYNDLNKIFEKYGCWYELGDSWNLTVCID